MLKSNYYLKLHGSEKSTIILNFLIRIRFGIIWRIMYIGSEELHFMVWNIMQNLNLEYLTHMIFVS